MVQQSNHKVGLRVLLSDEVSVESCGLPAEAVGLMLVVVGLEVGQKTGSHMLVLLSGSESGAHA